MRHHYVQYSSPGLYLHTQASIACLSVNSPSSDKKPLWRERENHGYHQMIAITGGEAMIYDLQIGVKPYYTTVPRTQTPILYCCWQGIVALSDSHSLCTDSLSLCTDSLSLCTDSLSLCTDSLFLCTHSVFLCTHSLSLCTVSLSLPLSPSP